MNRRQLLKSGAAITALMFLERPLSALGLDAKDDGELIPFLDQQPTSRSQLKWQDLDSWITPNEKMFAVSHYGMPPQTDAKYRLDVSGLLNKPRGLSLEEIKARKRKTVTATLECSGNSSNPSFAGAIGNVKWTGTPLAALLRECQPKARAIEVVFFGADEKTEKIREQDYQQNFARSLSLNDAMREDILLAYEMNGEPLAKDHGAPVRLVVPGWFGIAWVKWLTRIEVIDRRYMSKYMAREYVTIRGEERDGKTIWRETSVGPIDTKSVIARATKQKSGSVRLTGAAWSDGTPLKRVEVQIRKDLKEQSGDKWMPATLDKAQSKYSWRFFQFDWAKPEPGEYYVVSRATDEDGRIQPSGYDPEIQLKRTYWEANQQWVRKIKIS